jgi:hypothetical protein
MDYKLLFALISCILAVAQARPAAVAPSSTSSCSLSCSGRKFWTGYAAGKTYQYSFQQKVELKSSLSQEKSVLMQVSGKANFEVHSDCEMVLTVDIQETKSSKSPSEAANLEAKSLPKALVDSLKAPLRFSFEDGRVGDICPGSEETRASLNFKRGLLSQLHLSIDQPDQETTVREMTFSATAGQSTSRPAQTRSRRPRTCPAAQTTSRCSPDRASNTRLHVTAAPGPLLSRAA